MSRKLPDWAKQTASHITGRVVAKYCTCGALILEERSTFWSWYEPYIISGRLITVALIMDRRLTLLERGGTFSSITLVATFGSCGITPDGEYVEAHYCGQQPVSSTPLTVATHGSRLPPLDFLPTATPAVGGDPWEEDITAVSNTLF